MRDVLVHHHLGLGDHLICNGMVRYLYEQIAPDHLYLPVKRRNLGTVSRMYADQPAIVALPVETDADVDALPQLAQCREKIRVGFEKTDPARFDVSFYESLGIPFSVRWSHFKIPRDAGRERRLEQMVGTASMDKFIFVHNRPSDGAFSLHIGSGLPKVTLPPIPPTDCLLDWCSIIEAAEEVHCVDSSVVHLAQSLGVKAGFFHNIRIIGRPFTLREDWSEIDYGQGKYIHLRALNAARRLIRL